MNNVKAKVKVKVEVKALKGCGKAGLFDLLTF